MDAASVLVIFSRVSVIPQIDPVVGLQTTSSVRLQLPFYNSRIARAIPRETQKPQKADVDKSHAWPNSNDRWSRIASVTITASWNSERYRAISAEITDIIAFRWLFRPATSSCARQGWLYIMNNIFHGGTPLIFYLAFSTSHSSAPLNLSEDHTPIIYSACLL